LQKHNVVPVMESTLLTAHKDLNIQIDSINKNIIKICSIKHLKFIDLNKTMSYDGYIIPSITIDGIHINKTGYRLWCKAIL